MNNSVILPKKLTSNYLFEIIGKINFVFSIQNKLKPNFFLDLSKIRDVDIIGMLVFYKFIEYTVEKNCFRKPQLYQPENAKINEFIKLYGFDELVRAYIKSRSLENVLRNLTIEKTNNFLIAPQALIRGNIKSKKKFDIDFEKELRNFYGKEADSLIESILTCAVEISSNFYNHAKHDTKSIILARGSKNFIEIACADTADGMLNTLKENDIYKNLKDEVLIKKAFKRGVTSKPGSNHMGYGLWLVKEIVKKYNGFLDVYSLNTNFSIKFGKQRIQQSPYWQGTLIYLKLPIGNNGIDIGDLLRQNRKSTDLVININFS